jgi:hypothetical protein
MMSNIIQPEFLTIVMLIILAAKSTIFWSVAANCNRALPTVHIIVHHLDVQVTSMLPTIGVLMANINNKTPTMTLGAQACTAGFLTRNSVLVNRQALQR